MCDKYLFAESEWGESPHPCCPTVDLPADLDGGTVGLGPSSTVELSKNCSFSHSALVSRVSTQTRCLWKADWQLVGARHGGGNYFCFFDSL